MREQDIIDGVVVDERIIPDWEVADAGGTATTPRGRQPLVEGSKYPLAKSEVVGGEVIDHEGPEDPMKRLLVLGGLATLATAAVSVFSGNKPETQSPSIEPDVSDLSLDARLASIREQLEQLDQQGLTIPTPQAKTLAEYVAKLAENPATVIEHIAPPSVSSVETAAGPVVSAAQRPPEVKPDQAFLRQVQVNAAELLPFVAPVRNMAPPLRAVSWNEAPLSLKQQIPNPEAVAAPSLEELQAAFTGLITGLAQGDDRTIERQTAWLRQNAPFAIQPLVTSLTSSADKLITLQDAGALYPTPFVYQIIKTIHQLDPTTPEGKTLLDKALRFQEAHLKKLAHDAKEMTDAVNAIKAHPQTIEFPQAVMSPAGIHIVPPPDVVDNLVNEPAQDGGGLILGPIPGFRLAICPSDPLGKLVDAARIFAGLQPLGPFRYTIQRIEEFGNIVPASLRGSKLGWLNDLADRIPITYAELSPKGGLFDDEGFGPPIYMLNAAGLQEGDEIGFGGIVDILLKSIGQNP